MGENNGGEYLEHYRRFFVAYWPWILGVFTGGIGLVVGYVITKLG